LLPEKKELVSLSIKEDAFASTRLTKQVGKGHHILAVGAQAAN
jgi:hypothetical protein